MSQTYRFWELNLRLFERNWREQISQNYPFLVLSALKTSKNGRFEKLVGEDFSNPPLAECFSPENVKRGRVWEIGLQQDSNPVPAGQDQRPIR